MTLKPEHIVEALNKKTFDEIDPDEVHCNGVGIGVCSQAQRSVSARSSAAETVALSVL